MPYDASPASGCHLNLVRCGDRGRPLVVLVHAVGLDLTYWGPQIEALGADYDVVAYDLRGHGRSTAPLDGYDFASLAADLAAVVTHAENGPAHLIGLSVGGMIAQTLAVTRPELVRSLALIDTVSTFADEVRAALRQRAQAVRFGGMGAVLQPTLERWFAPAFAGRRPDVVDRVAKTLLAGSPDVHAAMWDTIATLDVAPALHTVRVPTLVLVGELDPTTPVAASQAIAQRIAGAELAVLPQASHMAPIEMPGLVNERLRAFLAGC